MASKDTITTLNELIETSKDGEKGFNEAAKLVRSPDLRRVLEEFSMECANAARQLQECVVEAGGAAGNTGTTMGKAHRQWMNLKANTVGSSEKAVLEECERGEDHAKAVYKAALKAKLPSTIRPVVERQYEGTVRHHDRIRALRDEYEAAA